MTAKEVREYRNVCKKLADVEERSKLLENLMKNRVCLASEECFVLKTAAKFRSLGSKKGVISKQREELVLLSLKYKIKDNNLFGVKLRRRRTWLRGRLEEGLGKKSKEYREITKDVREYTTMLKKKLRVKNMRKVENLVKKYVRKDNNQYMDKEMKDLVGTPRIFCEEMVGEDIRDPVIVEGEGETINLSPEEYEVLKLGPKF